MGLSLLNLQPFLSFLLLLQGQASSFTCRFPNSIAWTRFPCKKLRLNSSIILLNYFNHFLSLKDKVMKKSIPLSLEILLNRHPFPSSKDWVKLFDCPLQSGKEKDQAEAETLNLNLYDLTLFQEVNRLSSETRTSMTWTLQESQFKRKLVEGTVTFFPSVSWLLLFL